ncbi:MAG TPA: hypothetical protein VF796_12830 [Humisphaera sp.]
MATRVQLTLLATVVLSVGLASFVFMHWTGCEPVPAPPPAAEAYVGLTEAQIVDRLGPPGGTTEGTFEKVPPGYLKRHPTARTHRYQYPSGTLYVSIEQVGENWVCFDTDWVPADAAR